MTFDIKITGLTDLLGITKKIDRQKQEFVDECSKQLAAKGQAAAEHAYRATWYATYYPHPHDVVVRPYEYEGNGHIKLKATGEDVMFIEFGAGIHNPNHPADWLPQYTPGVLFTHGSYGQQKGKRKYWAFYEEGTTHNGKQFVNVTQGNKPAKGMYEARKAILTNYEQVSKNVSKKVFK